MNAIDHPHSFYRNSTPALPFENRALPYFNDADLEEFSTVGAPVKWRPISSTAEQWRLFSKFQNNTANFNSLSSRIQMLEEEVLMLRQTINGRGIERTPGVCGGSARIVRTRIPIWTLESYRRQGATESGILKSFPSLTAGDLVNAWAYVAINSQEIEKDIFENEAD